MNKKTKIIVGMLTIILIIVMAIITEIILDTIYLFKLDNSMSKEEISVMVNENKTKLDEVVEEIIQLEYEETEKKEKYFINKLNAKRKISNIYKSVNNNNKMEYIYFSCGGKGLDYYCGFYYSPNNYPLIMGGNNEDLKPHGDGWHANINGLNYYTEKIADNYFYYEDIY